MPTHYLDSEKSESSLRTDQTRITITAERRRWARKPAHITDATRFLVVRRSRCQRHPATRLARGGVRRHGEQGRIGCSDSASVEACTNHDAVPDGRDPG